MTEPGSPTRREQLGVWLKDRWRWERALRSPTRRYLGLANRSETLEPAPDGEGFACCWTYTSRLHASQVQPRLAQRLLQRGRQRWRSTAVRVFGQVPSGPTMSRHGIVAKN